jgi:hypothetical protein
MLDTLTTFLLRMGPVGPLFAKLWVIEQRYLLQKCLKQASVQVCHNRMMKTVTRVLERVTRMVMVVKGVMVANTVVLVANHSNRNNIKTTIKTVFT